MLKVKVRWQGFTGSPGYSNFYFDDKTGDFLTNVEAIAVADRVKTFFTNIKGMFPNIVTWKVQSDVEQIHATTGELFGVETIPDIPTIVGSGGVGAYSAASGAVVTWRTAGVRNGRRVRGRTFLVPIANITYGTDGSLEAVSHGTLTTQAGMLAAPANDVPLGVWSRPSGPAAEDGEWHPVTSASVPDMAAVLRSRRD